MYPTIQVTDLDILHQHKKIGNGIYTYAVEFQALRCSSWVNNTGDIATKLSVDLSCWKFQNMESV